MREVEMKFRNLILNLGRSLVAGIRRFPVPMLLSAALAILLVRINHFPDGMAESVRNDWMRAVIACIMGFPVTLSIHLLLERLARPPFYKPVRLLPSIAAFIPAAAGLFAYAWFMLPDFRMVPILRAILITAALVIGFACLPYWWRREGIALHGTRLLIRALITVLYAGILMLSLFAILFTLDRLLGVAIKDKHYGDAAILVWALFAPFHFFSGIPGIREVPKPGDSPKTLRFLLQWILIPLLWVYTAILYAYSGKILIEQAWPHGIVSSLILAYSCIGLFVWLLSYPARDDNRMAALHHRWFPWAALPLFIVLFAAIGLRVGEYGLTEPRWFALILGAWCAAATLFLSIRTLFRKRDPETAGFRVLLLPLSLAVVALSSVIGPFSAFNLSINSQNRELYAIFSKNGMLMGSQVAIAVSSVNEEDRARIASILYWFEQQHKLADAGSLPAGFTFGDAEKVLGFTLDGTTPAVPIQYVRFTRGNMSGTVPVAGYDVMFPFANEAATITDEASGLALAINQETRVLTLSRNGTEVYREDFVKRVDDLRAAYGKNSSQTEFSLTPDEMTFDTLSGDMRIRLVLRQIDGNTSAAPADGVKPGYAEGWLLVDLP
jgi:hypothetical protein